MMRRGKAPAPLASHLYFQVEWEPKRENSERKKAKKRKAALSIHVPSSNNCNTSYSDFNKASYPFYQ